MDTQDWTGEDMDSSEDVAVLPGTADTPCGSQDKIQFAKRPAAPSDPTPDDPQERPPIYPGFGNFQSLAQIGKGIFAEVMLIETKVSKELYAIKTLKKELLIMNDEIANFKMEKNILLKARAHAHPFIAQLYSTFQTGSRLHFVMEYAAGGNLMFHMQKDPLGMRRARFYAAEVCLALKFFHENSILYRNLKLENILLSQDGHIRLVGFGIAKELLNPDATTSTFCGTQEFMAPEILLDKPYGLAVDWWAFGVLLYQMLLNTSPFLGEDEDQIYNAILVDEPLYPVEMPEDAQTIVAALLRKEPKERTGSNSGFEEVRLQSFFQGLDWDALYEKRITPPIIPELKDATDISNFDTEHTSIEPVMTPITTRLSSQQQEEFRGFEL